MKQIDLEKATRPKEKEPSKMWELRQEGDRLALYFLGEYQFRATVEEMLELYTTIGKFRVDLANMKAEEQQKADGEKFLKEHPAVPVVDIEK